MHASNHTEFSVLWQKANQNEYKSLMLVLKVLSLSTDKYDNIFLFLSHKNKECVFWNSMYMSNSFIQAHKVMGKKIDASESFVKGLPRTSITLKWDFPVSSGWLVGRRGGGWFRLLEINCFISNAETIKKIVYKLEEQCKHPRAYPSYRV